MIDFKNPSFVKLGEVDNAAGLSMVGDLLIEDESIFASFKGARDMVIFTNRRIIAVNVQGLSGKKKDFSSLPYSKIQAYSVESAGTFDRDTELELWFSGLGKVRFEFHAQFDVKAFSKFIGRYIL
jgi:Bacterial PH domain